MSQPIHDDEPDTGEAVVRALLAADLPHLANAPVEYLQTSGTDNAMWRVVVEGSSDLVVRLPRRSGAAGQLTREAAVMQQLRGSELADVVAVPAVVHVGDPQPAFGHPWAVYEWLDGDDAWSAREGLDLEQLAVDISQTVARMRHLRVSGVRQRRRGERGGPIEAVLERLDRWLTDPAWNARALIDVDAVAAIAAQAVGLPDAEPVFVHGDLIPGNLLVLDGRLSAVIDWGGAGYGDPAQDLAPAWSVLDGPGRQIFRRLVEADDQAWIRGRTIELEHAVGAVLYYVPRGHQLGDVMERTLGRIIEDASGA